MLSINKFIYVEDTFCYRDYVCEVSKLQHIYAIVLIPLSVLETTKETGYIKYKSKDLKQIKSMISLTDLCYNKKFELEKKS